MHVYNMFWSMPSPFPSIYFAYAAPSLFPSKFVSSILKPRVHLVLSVCAQVQDHLPSMGSLSRATSLKPTDLPSLNRNQWATAPHLGVGWGFMTPSPIHAGILSGLISHRSCTCVIATVSSHVQSSGHAQQIWFHCSHPLPPALKNLSASSSVMIPEPWGQVWYGCPA